MISGTQQAILIGVSIAAFYALNFVLIAYYAPQRKNRSWKLSYTLWGLALTLLLTLQPVLLPWLGLYTSARWGLWIQLVGIFLMICSLLLQLWSRLHLGRFYAERAEFQPGHQLISTGPYTHVRHPLFTSYFMFITGLLLVAPNLLMFLALVYVWWDFSHAAIRDEKIMSEHMPEYVSYMAQTPRFFPNLTGLSSTGSSKKDHKHSATS